jgi:hypothetical protein
VSGASPYSSFRKLASDFEKSVTIVTDLTDAGYVVKEKQGRRNRYSIQAHLPLRQAVGREPTIGEVLELLVDTKGTD